MATKLRIHRPEGSVVQNDPHFDVAFRLLLRAYDYAKGLKCGLREFAVEIQGLRSAGVNGCDLRVLVKMRYVAHALEVTGPRSTSRVFRAAKNLAFTERSCFVLTEQGVSYARRILRSPRIADHSRGGSGVPSRRRGSVRAITPRWDAQRRTLFLGDAVVKKFPRVAPNQELILQSFQNRNWACLIEDPLPPRKGHNSKIRLHDTIKKLNQFQTKPLIRFCGDGTGRGLSWKLVE